VNSALIRFIYPRRWLGRGVGLNATVGSIASALGPSVASAILAVATLALVIRRECALGILGAVIALRALPMTPLSGIKFDIISAGLQAVTFGTLLFGISEFGHGDSWTHIGVELIVAVASGCVLVARQMRPHRTAAPCRPAAQFHCSHCRWRVRSAPSSPSRSPGVYAVLFQHRFNMTRS